MTFKKNDKADNKPDWSLFPFDGAELVVRVLEMGARKYDRDNWREGATDPEAQRRIWSAIIRHLSALQRGENLDPESDLPHVAHVACNALFLCAFNQMHAQAAREAAADDGINVTLATPMAELRRWFAANGLGHLIRSEEEIRAAQEEAQMVEQAKAAGVQTKDRAAVEDTTGLPTAECPEGPDCCPDCREDLEHGEFLGAICCACEV